MNLPENKWLRGAIPALLLHCSIGTVYCWSVFSQEVAAYIGSPKSHVEWAFSLAIFFLGMSAAFLGDFVEKDIHKSSLIATIFFTVGMVGTGASILAKSLPGVLVCYGVIMGIGLGTGYLSPVKTLMLWFKDKKGLATGLAVAGFGAAKAIATPIMQAIVARCDDNPAYMFMIMGGVYCVMMFIGHLLLKKPAGWVEAHDKQTVGEFLKKFGSNFKTCFSNREFLGIWIMFYINIACGLALISQEKPILQTTGLGFMTISAIGTVTAIANAAGRLGFSAFDFVHWNHHRHSRHHKRNGACSYGLVHRASYRSQRGLRRRIFKRSHFAQRPLWNEEHFFCPRNVP